MTTSVTAPGGRETPARYREAGKWLRSLRHYWQLTQWELAEQTGIPDPEMVDWIEAGEVRPPVYAIAALARAFGMDRREFAESCALYYNDRDAAAAA